MGQGSHIRVKPKQSLGQNFLVDDNIARNIARDLCLHSDDVVIEIGAGQGALTSQLADKVKHLIAVEIDGRVVDELKKRFSSSGVLILHKDFMDVRIEEWSAKFKRRVRIVGNIPYHLTSQILFKVFDERASVQDVTVMMQKEVAQRLVAKPSTKSYGILSVCAQFYGIPRVLFYVSPNCFYPKPKVTSSVIQIQLNEKLKHSVDEELFRTVVRTVFGKRRKTLRNSLKFLPFEEAKVNRIISTVDIPLKARPEELTVEQLVDITNKIERTKAA